MWTGYRSIIVICKSVVLIPLFRNILLRNMWNFDWAILSPSAYLERGGYKSSSLGTPFSFFRSLWLWEVQVNSAVLDSLHVQWQCVFWCRWIYLALVPFPILLIGCTIDHWAAGVFIFIWLSVIESKLFPRSVFNKDMMTGELSDQRRCWGCSICCVICILLLLFTSDSSS